MLLLNQKKERRKDFPYFVPLCTAKEFESGYGSTIDVNDEVQVEAYTNMDGSGTAIKFQVGPL